MHQRGCFLFGNNTKVDAKSLRLFMVLMNASFRNRTTFQSSLIDRFPAFQGYDTIFPFFDTILVYKNPVNAVICGTIMSAVN